MSSSSLLREKVSIKNFWIGKVKEFSILYSLLMTLGKRQQDWLRKVSRLSSAEDLKPIKPSPFSTFAKMAVIF